MTDTAAATETVLAVAREVWRHKLEHPMLRLYNDLPVTQIPRSSLAEAAADVTHARAWLARLAPVNTQALVETDRLTLEFMRHELSQWQLGDRNWQTASPLTPYASMGHGYLADTLLRRYRIDSPEALQTWASLWSDMAAALCEVRHRADVQAKHGWRLAQPAIDNALEGWQQLQRMLRALLTPSEATAATVSPSQRLRWSERAERLRDAEVLPAVQSVIDLLCDSGYRSAAPERVGLMHLPGGDEAYRMFTHMHLTLPDDPQRIHDLGLEQVQMLAERMSQVRSRLGFDGSEAEFHRRLKSDPRVIALTPEAVMQRYQACIDRMAPLLGQWFTRIPKAPYGVLRLPSELEAGMTYGYYDRPKKLGDPGLYRFSAADLPNRSQLQAAALIYHELAPGHHFHMSRQAEMEHLPDLRRNAMDLSIYNEGWAEYASSLAEEMGLYDDPLDLYGRLANERLLSQRLVVDTGMNALGWTLKQARTFMRENTLEGEAQIASETLRYSTDMPAQALAYRLGHLAFQKLRDETRHRRGAAFDVCEFHEAVLGEGALPLAALRGHVERVMP